MQKPTKYNLLIFPVLLFCFALGLSGCADDISTYEQPDELKEDCPANSCDSYASEGATSIEKRKNREKRQKNRIREGKPVPGIYHPFNQGNAFPH